MANENQTAKERPEYLLEVKGLKKYFDITHGFSIGKGKQYLRAVDGVSFAIRPGETLGLVGESGCGKSTTGNCIIRLLDPSEGEVLFEGRDIAKMSPKELKPLRRDIQMIFQDPYSSLDPRMRVFDLIAVSYTHLKHAFKNALVPVVTIVALQIPNLVGGALITETVFAWPGLGQLVVQSIGSHDMSVVQACVVIIALITMAANLLADLVYCILDPRIRY